MFETLEWKENISLYNVEKFEKSITELLRHANGPYLILNMEDVSYMNSRSLGIIANAVKEAKQMKKELIIINNQGTMKEIFEIVRFYTIVKVFSSIYEGERYLLKLASSSKRKVV